jgi:hypothetical protein
MAKIAYFSQSYECLVAASFFGDYLGLFHCAHFEAYDSRGELPFGFFWSILAVYYIL